MVRTFIVLVATCTLLHASAQQGRGPRFPFTANKGQWPEQVLYRTLTGQGALFVERDALTYVVRSGGHAHGHRPDHVNNERHDHAYRVHFVGGRATSHQGSDQQAWYENWFVGPESSWAGRVPVHAGARLTNLYPGIDLVLHGDDRLEYDLHVAPGADVDAVALRYEGHDSIELRNGRLVITTSAGQVTEEAPVAWQDIDGKRRDVPCHFILTDGTVRFELPQGYDRRHPLTIDPVLTFSSFSGSTADNFGFTATYDNAGHLYGGGIVFGVGYPTTLGVQQPNFGGNTIDMGITKFSPDGTQLIWSTYLGGLLGNESPHSLVVNSADELYVMGITGSADFPVTSGCFDNSFGAGPGIVFTVGEGYNHDNGTDICVAHFSADATQLLGCTYVGGSQADGLNNSTVTAWNYGDPFRGEIVLDSQERPVVASCTMSSDIPTTPGAAFPAYLGGEQDGYVFSLDPLLTTQLWATYYGGAGTDACYSVQLADNDDVLVTGGTNSPNMPLTGQGYLGSPQGGVDGFAARFNPGGTLLIGATYLGTAAYDQGYFVQLDQDQNVFVVGQTHGAYPVTPGKYTNPNSSQFIHKLSGDLSTSLWSTVIGSGQGNEDISPAAFLVSNCSQIFFSGWGGSVNTFQQAVSSSTFGLPITPDAFQNTTDGSDFYLLVLEPEATDIHYGTFFGGSTSLEHVDGGTSRFSKTGVVYQAVCAGCGGNSDMPTSSGAWSNTNNSANCNLGVFKIDFEVAVSASFFATPPYGCTGDTLQFISTGSATQWAWDFGDGTTTNGEANPAHAYATAGTWPVTLIATDTNACNLSDTLVLMVQVQSPANPSPAFTTEQEPCGGLTVSFNNATPGVGQQMLWDMGDGNTYTSEDATHTYATFGSYTVTLTVTDTLCGGSASTTQEVVLTATPEVEALFSVSSTDICSGLSVATTNESSGPAGLTYSWDMGDGTVLSGPDATHLYAGQGSYTITLTAVDTVCLGSDTYTFEVTVTPGAPPAELFVVPNVFSPNGDGKNETFFPLPEVSGSVVSLKVFNRWGQKLYETGNAFRPWNGKADLTDPVPAGVYYYVLDYRVPCSGQVLEGERKGLVQLLR